MSCPCAECMAAVDAIALARELTVPLPQPAHIDQVRASLLAASRTDDVLAPIRAPRRARLPYLVAAAAIAASVVLFVLARGSDRPAPGHAHASIRPLPGASFLAISSAPDELVVLNDGAIDVAVAPLHPRERFRVLVGADEIEVHGTEFIVTARAGTLVDVRVVHGIVEVRSQRAPATFLRAGEVWRAPSTVVAVPLASPAAPSVDASPTPARPTPSRVITRAPRTSLRATTIEAVPLPAKPADALPHETAYDEGWTALREGRFAQAAKSFLRVQLLDPDGALTEDATYFQAVALARGHDRLAMGQFREFLSAYPASRRAGEASAMLGWLLVDAHESAEAKRRFRAALDDSNPAVRKSAQAGLDALDEK